MASWPSTRTYLALAVVAIVLSLLSTARYGSDRLAWLFGPVPDPIGVALVTAMGWFALRFIDDRGGDDDPRLVPFLAIHLTVIGVVELALLRRSGLGAMFALRLTCYLWWHIVWGHARLSILF